MYVFVCVKLGFDLESVCFAWIYIIILRVIYIMILRVFTRPSYCGHICVEPCLGAHVFLMDNNFV